MRFGCALPSALLAILLGIPVGLQGRITEAGVPTAGVVVVADTVPTVEEIVAGLGPEGDPALAAEGIRLLIQHRPANEATHWIQLLSVLDRVDPAAAPIAGQAVALADGGDWGAGVDWILASESVLAPEDRGTLLALAALLSESVDPTRAAALRMRVIEEAPDALEAPELTLRQARWLLSIDARRDEGFRMVEDLIVASPSHPIAPEARRLLQLERRREL